MLQAIQHHRNLLKSSLTFSITGLCLLILGQRIASIEVADVSAALQGITLSAWVLALCATGISFLAVGQYDVVWHRHLKTNVSDRRARSSGMAAIAVGQAVGLGALTGTFVRWHVLKEQSFKTAAAVTIAVSLSFLLCWSLFALAAAFQLELLNTAQTILAFVAAVVVAGVICVRSKTLQQRRSLSALIILTCIDIVFAGVALWVLMPSIDASVFVTVIAAYVLALGAGLISNAPGGVGAFELVLLSLLSMTPEATVLAGVCAFRLVYYLVPALLGGGLMLCSHVATSTTGPRQNIHAAPPVSDLCHQGAQLMTSPKGVWVVRRHLLGTVAIEPDGIDLTQSQPFWQFQVMYKTGLRHAALARRSGWQVRLIAQNAIIDPSTWSESGPQRSGLRRKLKQACKSGVRITRVDGALPYDQMDSIAAAWANKNCGELGYAMGRYTRSYVKQQQVYLIWQNTTLCGFVTVQTRADAWGLDLIRHLPAMPSGAMHAAIKAIIDDAQQAGVSRFNLGAVPDGPPEARLQLYCARNKAGLRQFKASFGPDWEPLYHVAPNVWQWGISMLVICAHIQRPLPRMAMRLRAIIMNLIKKANIIHLPHNKASGIERSAPAHERPLL